MPTNTSPQNNALIPKRQKIQTLTVIWKTDRTTNSVVGVVMEIDFGILHKRAKVKVNLVLIQ